MEGLIFGILRYFKCKLKINNLKIAPLFLSIMHNKEHTQKLSSVKC